MSSMNLKDLSLNKVSTAAFSELDVSVIHKATDLGLVLVGGAALGIWGSVMGFKHPKRKNILEFVSFDKDASNAFLKWLGLSVDPTKIKVEVTLVKSHRLDESFTKRVQDILTAVPEYLVVYKALKHEVKDIDFVKCLLPVCDFDLVEAMAEKLKLTEKSYDFLNSITDALSKDFISDSSNSGCLMLALEVPYLREVRGLIDARDLYMDGVELETHVTVAYGFDTSLYSTFDSLAIDSDTSKLSALITGVSFFENSKYDVCKLDIMSPSLNKLNAWLKDNIGFETTFDKYIPHVTIAYLKPGMAKKYKPLIEELTSTLKFPVPVTIGDFFYSVDSGSGFVVTTPSETTSKRQS